MICSPTTKGNVASYTQLAFSSPQQEGIRLTWASGQASTENTDVEIYPSWVGKGPKDKRGASEPRYEHWQESGLSREEVGFQRSEGTSGRMATWVSCKVLDFLIYKEPRAFLQVPWKKPARAGLQGQSPFLASSVFFQ